MRADELENDEICALLAEATTESSLSSWMQPGQPVYHEIRRNGDEAGDRERKSDP
jgi:hypothetical protein